MFDIPALEFCSQWTFGTCVTISTQLLLLLPKASSSTLLAFWYQLLTSPQRREEQPSQQGATLHEAKHMKSNDGTYVALEMQNFSIFLACLKHQKWWYQESVALCGGNEAL